MFVCKSISKAKGPEKWKTDNDAWVPRLGEGTSYQRTQVEKAWLICCWLKVGWSQEPRLISCMSSASNFYIFVEEHEDSE